MFFYFIKKITIFAKNFLDSKMLRKLSALLISGLLVFGYANAQNAEVKDPDVILIKELNQLRAEGCMCGNVNARPVGSLIWNKQLASIAKEYAEQLKENNQTSQDAYLFISHIGTDGSTLTSRLENAGYSAKNAVENIAFISGNEDMVIDYWLNNPESCQNIMDKKMTTMGAAKSGNFWVLILTQK